MGFRISREITKTREVGVVGTYSSCAEFYQEYECVTNIFLDNYRTNYGHIKLND